MGKQFRFIMDEIDKVAFFEYVVMQEGRVYETKKMEGTIEKKELPEYLWINLYLSKAIFGNIVFKENLPNKKYIDTTGSPVIEFGNTIIRENVKEIQRGRLFLETKYYDLEGNLIQKSNLLDKWYKELVKWIKNNLQCIEISNNEKIVKEYVSKSLIKYVEAGYKLLG